ncbi:MAG: MATE family efflux transporter [Lachnospiraceae bacterium]
MGLDFTTGPVMPLLLRFFLPFLLANVLNSLYNTVDTIVIGHFVGSNGIVAVNMGGKMLEMFSMVGIAVAGGGQTLIAQLTGSKRREDISRTIGTLFTFLLIMSMLTAAVMLIFAKPVLTLLNTPEESFLQALQYLRITCIGLPLLFGYTAVSAILRGMGDSKSPLIYIAIAATFNLIGDIVFVAVFHMGAAGTAIATVMGQGISLVFSLVRLYSKRESFGFDFRIKSFAISAEKLKIIIRLGFPMALRGFFIKVTQLGMFGFINDYGLTQAAAYSIGDKIYRLANVFVMSVTQAGSGMIGQNIGADRRDRVKPIMKCVFAMSMGFALLISAVALLFPKQIYGLFTSDPAVISYAPRFMAICCLIFIACAIMGTYDGVVTGTGASMLSFLGGFLDGVLFRITLSLLFAWVFDMGIEGFFLGEAMARLGPIIVGMIYYHSGAWLKKKKLVESM